MSISFAHFDTKINSNIVTKCYRQLTTLYFKSNISNDNLITYSNFVEDADTPCKTIGCKTVQY